MIKNTRNQLRGQLAQSQAYGPLGALLCVLRTLVCMTDSEFVTYVRYAMDNVETVGFGFDEGGVIWHHPLLKPLPDGTNLLRYAIGCRASLLDYGLVEEAEMQELMRKISEWPSICMVRNESSDKYAIRDTFALWEEVFALGKDLKSWCADHGLPYEETNNHFLEVTL